MAPVARHVLAGALGLLLLAAVLVLLTLGDLLLPEPPELFAVREVEHYQPPPPPPPPPVKRERLDNAATPDLSAANMDVPVELGTMPLVISLSPGEVALGSGFNGDIGVDFGNVELGELDVYPVVISSPAYPASRELRGDTNEIIELRLHIAIDEEGNAWLINILTASHPQPRRVVENFVARVKFTPPTLLGTPVRTEFIWPLSISPL